MLMRRENITNHIAWAQYSWSKYSSTPIPRVFTWLMRPIFAQVCFTGSQSLVSFDSLLYITDGHKVRSDINFVFILWMINSPLLQAGFLS